MKIWPINIIKLLVASTVVLSKVNSIVVFFIAVAPVVCGFCVGSWFCRLSLRVISSFTVILLKKRGLVAIL